jgi:DNA/RNA-binding domain of Phe-tRNA-synthetase-like protein
MTADPELFEGFVDASLAAEFPELRVVWVEVAGAPGGKSPPELRERLRVLSDKLRGAQAIALRGRDVPHAYRVFFRHIGLDPDVVRVPVEALMMERLMHGGYPSRGWLPDACSIACIETGVPVWALDADRLDGPLGVRAGDDGRLELADAAGRVAMLFGVPGPAHAPSRETRRLALVTVVVPGVPALYAEEALWIAGEALQT